MGYGGSYKDAARQLGRSGEVALRRGQLGSPGSRPPILASKAIRSWQHGGPSRGAGVTGSLVGLGATKGVFVTTSTFTSHARDFPKQMPQGVVLIDGDELTDLMVEHEVGVRTSRSIAFKRLDEDFFSEDD